MELQNYHLQTLLFPSMSNNLNVNTNFNIYNNDIYYNLPQMEPLIKESTSRLVEKISAAAENGETVEALQ